MNRTKRMLFRGDLASVALRGSKRLGGFTASTAFLAAASLLLMPATIHAVGMEAWSSVVLGQALAQLVAFVGGYGYGLNGPTIVAGLDSAAAIDFFFTTQRTRLIITIPCITSAVAAMYVIPNPSPLIGLLGAAPVALVALSASFFFVGRASPLLLFWADTTPRGLSMLLGASVLATGGSVTLGLTLPIVGAVLATTISNIAIKSTAVDRSDRRPSGSSTTVRSELRTQLAPLISSLLRGSTFALPPLLLATFAGGIVGVFGVFDRVRRQALAAFAPFTATLQGWVPRRVSSTNTWHAAAVGALAGLAGAIVSLVLFMLLGGRIIHWLSAGSLNPSWIEILICAMAIATSIVIQVNDLACLLPLRCATGVLINNLTGNLLLIPLMAAFLFYDRSVTSALGALVVANLLQITIQMLYFALEIRNRRIHQPKSPSPSN